MKPRWVWLQGADNPRRCARVKPKRGDRGMNFCLQPLVTLHFAGRATPACVRCDAERIHAHNERVRIERRVRQLLAIVYTDDGVRVWLNSPNRNFMHARPIELLASNPWPVLTEAQTLADATW